MIREHTIGRRLAAQQTNIPILSLQEDCEIMSGTRHAKSGISQRTSATSNEMTHWRAPKHPPIRHYGADCRSRSAQRRWNPWPLAALLINVLLWAGLYWIIAAFF
ncbi:hypothetical protein XH96_32625 [Bradyrhizobium sp. CCBAU 51765]|nr:hypothetical protein XH96_32625 [Bradyrhizobium sp. CCBAU 51765]